MARILVLGNLKSEREGLALFMEFAGHSCAETGSLQEAGKLLRKEVYDVVLADATIGDSNSEQIVRTLKGVSPRTTVMILSEEADPHSAAADEVITLPFSPIRNLSPQFSPVRKREAFLVLLPEQESLKMLRNLPETPGMLNKLAVLYHSQEKYVAAERLYKRALEISEKTSGQQRREVASILNNLASLYHDQEKYAKAAPLYQRSLALVEKAYGPTHSKVARRLRNLVDLYRAQGKDKEAAPLYERLKKMEKTSRT